MASVIRRLLVIGGIALLALSLLVPDLSVLLCQAATLGIVLALLARLVRFVLMRGQPTLAAVRGRTPFTDSKIVEVRLSRADGSSKITTASAPAAIQVPSAESKS